PTKTSFCKMEAIAMGVRARFEERLGYTRKVTDETVNIARALGVPDSEIEKWASNHLSQVARDTEILKEIRSHLVRLYGNTLAA
ncbi:MAG: hypothetical protein ABID71_05890, partial [Chloroflexota bacterium]